MRPINIAIVGAGVWGDTHAAIYREHPLANPVAICDMNLGRAQKVAERYAIPSAYGSVDEMLRAGGFEAVSIVTPDFLHADAAVACAMAGKHLLIEKPIATNAEDVRRIVSAARQAGVRVMVDLHNRWSPPFAAAKEAISRGELGEVRHGYFRLNDIKWVATDMLSWSKESSILWFLGSHSLDTLQWLFDDEIVRVYSAANRGVLDGLGIETTDTYLTTLEFKRGGIAQMENSWIAPNANPNINDIKCSIYGSKGSIAIDATHHNLIQQFSDDKAIVPDVLVRNRIHGRVKGFAYESIRSFVDCLVTGQPFVVSMEDAARTTMAILKIVESAQTRTPIEVKYDF